MPNEELVHAAIDLAQRDLVKRIGRLELLPLIFLVWVRSLENG
jgi:hypothetical protein